MIISRIMSECSLFCATSKWRGCEQLSLWPINNAVLSLLIDWLQAGERMLYIASEDMVSFGRWAGGDTVARPANLSLVGIGSLLLCLACVVTCDLLSHLPGGRGRQRRVCAESYV